MPSLRYISLRIQSTTFCVYKLSTMYTTAPLPQVISESTESTFEMRFPADIDWMIVHKKREAEMKALGRALARVTQLVVLVAALAAAAEAKGGTTCVACGLIAGLLFEKKSGGAPIAVADIVGGAGREDANAQLALNPDHLCSMLGLCDAGCKLFPDKWPVTPPKAPPEDPKNDGGESEGGESRGEAVGELAAALQRLILHDQNSRDRKEDLNFFDLPAKLTGVSASAAAAAAADALPSLSDAHPCAKTNVSAR